MPRSRGVHTRRFQIQLLVTSFVRHLKNVRQHARRNTLAQMLRRRAHGFDLALLRVELF
jgi:hypothetical protein